MRKLLVLILFTCFVRFSSAQVTLDVVSFGGAVPNDELDDRESIQETIDAVNAAGGGMVTFPEGTFLVSKVADPSPIQVICLQIYSNITMKGAGRANSTIKLMPNAGNFDAMISCKPSWETITDFQLFDLTIDENGSNNSTPTQTILNNDGSRSVFRLYLGRKITIENCEFTNIKGVWGMVFNGIIDTVIINNNIFSNIGDDFVDWDHSSIYTQGQNFTITNNQIYSLHGAGTFGARTGIEIHGGNQYVANNIIRGMTGGLNVTGYSNYGYWSRNQTYYKNTITDALSGFTLWSGVGDDPAIAVGLENVLFEGNLVELNPEGWIGYQYYSGAAGFLFEQNRDRDLKRVYCINNAIRYVKGSIIPETDITSGLMMGANNYGGIRVKDFYFLNNTIENSFGPGIYLDDLIQQSVFSNNVIVNSGSSDAAIANSFRSGFFLGGKFSNLHICNNTLNDNQITPDLKQVISNYGYNDGNCLVYNNTTNIANAVPFYNDASSSGEAWITTLSKPAITFNTDSIFIARGGSDSSLKLQLSRPSSDTIFANLYFQDFITTDSSAFNVPQSQYVFIPGDTIETVTVNVLNNTLIKVRIMGELIIGYSEDAIPGEIQHCKLHVPALNNDEIVPDAPGGLESSDIGMNSFHISWKPADDNVAVIGYDIYLNGVLYAATSLDTLVLVTGLAPETFYKVTVRAKDGAGNYSGSSAVLPVTTLDDTLPPSVPGGLTARFISNDRFLLEWKAATDNDLVTGYDVFIDGIFYANTVALRLAITHLEPGTNYSITVIARDVAGNVSDQSELLSVTTSGTATASESISSRESTIKVFPNPAAEYITCTGLKQSATIKIFSILGTEVARFTSHYEYLNISNLERGIYFIEVCDGATRFTKKLIKE